MTRILGVDFSGARDAGNKIWIAEGRKVGGAFRLQSCLPAAALPGGGKQPVVAIAALRQLILCDPDTIVGCDFPFSLPASQLGAKSWTAFVAGFQDRFADPTVFYERFHAKAGDREVKRHTDIAEKTPFNSYNLRIHRQTWWGITHLLYPLTHAEAVVVRPQQQLCAGKPILIEVCPACSLKRIDCYAPYKGATAKHRQARVRILDRLIDSGLLSAPSQVLRKLILENPGGDALDAVVGAVAAATANLDRESDAIEYLEGRVYV